VHTLAGLIPIQESVIPLRQFPPHSQRQCPPHGVCESAPVYTAGRRRYIEARAAAPAFGAIGRDDEEEVAVRPEIQSTVDEIQQVIGLLRRHL
jgi:hypothetical protein